MPAAKPVPGSLGNADIIDLEALLGSSWQGFFLIGQSGGQGMLQHLHWKRPFEAGELAALFWKSQRADMLEHKIQQLQRETEQAHERADQAEADAAFYRRELRAASKLGLMYLQEIPSWPSRNRTFSGSRTRSMPRGASPVRFCAAIWS